MIGWIAGRLRELVIDPQTDPAIAGSIDLGAAYGAPGDPARVLPLTIVVDPEDVGEEHVQALSIVSTTSRPIDYAIAGTAVDVEIRHVIDAALAVQHGDLEAATRIRDRIVTALVLRLIDARAAFGMVDDPDTGQHVTRVEWAIDYRPVAPLDTPSEWARLTVTVDAELTR